MDGLQLVQYVLLAAVIAGVTELINRVRAKDYWAVATIATAALIGAVFGFYGLEGLQNVSQGMAVGFGLSGGIKVLSAVGKGSSAQPSNVVTKLDQ